MFSNVRREDVELDLTAHGGELVKLVPNDDLTGLFLTVVREGQAITLELFASEANYLSAKLHTGARYIFDTAKEARDGAGKD